MRLAEKSIGECMKIRVVMMMVCAGADRPTGHKCSICECDLAVSPAGLEKMEQSKVHLFCNPCGLECSKALEEAGVLQGVGLNPRALEKLKNGEKGPVADWVRKHYKEEN